MKQSALYGQHLWKQWIYLSTLILALSGVGTLNAPAVAMAAPNAADFAHRYVVFLDGIRTSSTEDSLLNGDFTKIEQGLRKIGVSHVVYFSYSAATYYPNRAVYCAGWAASIDCFGLSDPTMMRPVYSVDDTHLSVAHQADVLDWLLNRIVEFDPAAQIDLVGYSLGGVVESYWAGTTGGTSAIRSHIRSLVLIESPVGGIPLGFMANEDCGFVLLHPVCSLWKEILISYFGATVLSQLQLPESAAGSIVGLLPQAASNFPLTSIQSKADYLVNGENLPLCGYGCFSFTNDIVPIASGTQYWVVAPHALHFDQELGGDGLAAGPLGRIPAMDLLKKNHSEPLAHSQTVEWVQQAIQTLPTIVGRSGASTIVKTITTPAIPVKPDIVFLADTTGSMSGGIANVQLKATDVMSQVRAIQPEAQFGVAEYKDFDCDLNPYLLDQPITADTTAVQAAINANWAANGGCDTPEANLNALYQLATDIGTTGWRSNSTRIIAWFGDAPSHDPSGGHGLNDVIDALKVANIRVIAVNVSDLDGCAETCGQASAIVNATGGRLLALSSAVGAPLPPSKSDTLSSQNHPAVSALQLAANAADDVAGAILAGLQSLPVTVTPQVDGNACDPHVSVSFDPSSQTVTSGATATFTATVTISSDGAPNASLSCPITYLLDGKPVANDPTFSSSIAVASSWSTSPPTTLAVLDPAPNLAGWNAGDVAVTLKATDHSGGAGILSISYSASGAQPISSTEVFSDAETITITRPGQTTITFVATDNVGNLATRNTVVIKRPYQIRMPLALRS